MPVPSPCLGFRLGFTTIPPMLHLLRIWLLPPPPRLLEGPVSALSAVPDTVCRMLDQYLVDE